MRSCVAYVILNKFFVQNDSEIVSKHNVSMNLLCVVDKYHNNLSQTVNPNLTSIEIEKQLQQKVHKKQVEIYKVSSM